MPACTKRFSEGRFSEQVSEGGYASAGFAEAVKMPRAEARGASLNKSILYRIVHKFSIAFHLHFFKNAGSIGADGFYTQR